MMTEFLGEFDAASPAPKSFCARITSAQFDQQSSFNTERALQELLDYLEYNPTAFYNVIMKRKEEENPGGFMSYLKTKLISWFYDESPNEFNVSKAKEKLQLLKEDIIKSYNYGQEAKGYGRRFSHRLAEKKWRKVGEKSRIVNQMSTSFASNERNDITPKLDNTKTQIVFPVPPALENNVILQVPRAEAVSSVYPPPPPPPPPPLPPPTLFPELPLPKRNKKCEKRSHAVLSLRPVSNGDICQQRKLLKPALKIQKMENLHGRDDFTEIMQYIRKPNAREMLKPIQNRNNEEYDTPAQFYRKRKAVERCADSCNMFNEKLILKFKNTHGSPAIDSPRSDTGFTP